MRKNLSLLLVAFCLTATAQNRLTSASQSQIYITHVTVLDTETGKEATDRCGLHGNHLLIGVSYISSRILRAPRLGAAAVVEGLLHLPFPIDLDSFREPRFCVRHVVPCRPTASPGHHLILRAEGFLTVVDKLLDKRL